MKHLSKLVRTATLVILFGASLALAQTEKGKPRITCQDKHEQCNVHSGPGDSHPIIGIVQRGVEIEVIGSAVASKSGKDLGRRSWLPVKITLSGNQSRTGYAYVGVYQETYPDPYPTVVRSGDSGSSFTSTPATDSYSTASASQDNGYESTPATTTPTTPSTVTTEDEFEDDSDEPSTPTPSTQTTTAAATSFDDSEDDEDDWDEDF